MFSTDIRSHSADLTVVRITIIHTLHNEASAEKAGGSVHQSTFMEGLAGKDAQKSSGISVHLFLQS